MVTAWVVTTAVTASGLPFIDGDSATINDGGTLTWDIANADGAIDSDGFVVNAGGKFVIDVTAGTPGARRVDINTGKAITVNEGGQLLSLGTAASRVTIMGEDTTTTSHYIIFTGKFYSTYTDISNFYAIFASTSTTVGEGQFEMINGTIGTVQYPLYGARGAYFKLVNSTVDSATASRYVFTGLYTLRIDAINCVFTSTTDNYMASTGVLIAASFSGCTYQGAAIAPDDFSVTTCDTDLSIYEASVVASNVAGAHWSLGHPLMDNTGMVTTDQYQRVPGYLPYGQGNYSAIYTLNWTMYAPSGTSVADRVYCITNISHGGDITSGKWNLTCSAWNYQTNSTEVYSGTNATVNLTAVGGTGTTPALTQADAETYADALHATWQNGFLWGETAYALGYIAFNMDMDDVTINCTVVDDAGTEILYMGEVTTADFTADTPVDTGTLFGGDIDVDTGLLSNGSYSVFFLISHPSLTLDFNIYTQFYVYAADIPGLIDGAWIFPYNNIGNFQASFSIGDHVFPDGGATWTYDLAGVYVNATVWDDSGLVETLDSATEDYTAGVEIVYSVTYGATLDIDTTLYPVGDYLIQIAFEHPDIIDTFVYGEFTVLADPIPGFDDTIDLLLSGAAAGPPRGNYTVGETIYCAGSIETTYGLANVDVDMAVYINDGINTYVAWPDNDTFSFTAGTTYTPADIHGVQPSFSTAGWAAGDYTVQWNFTHADLDTIQIYSDFTLGYPPAAFVNISAYNSTVTSIANMQNRIDLGSTVYFNGTVETTYSVPAAVINITLNSPTGYLATLWNGTAAMVAGTARDFTDICGVLLNYTTTANGDYYVIVSVSADNFLNITTITEGFTVMNINQFNVVGTNYKLPAFFQYQLRPQRVVAFRDCSKVQAPSEITSVLWSFGDGHSAVTEGGEEVTHQYALPGEYNVTITTYYVSGITTIDTYSSQVEVVEMSISWAAYAAIGALVFAGLLAIGVYAAEKKSKRIAAGMYVLLGAFVIITVIALQIFVE